MTIEPKSLHRDYDLAKSQNRSLSLSFSLPPPWEILTISDHLTASNSRFKKWAGDEFSAPDPLRWTLAWQQHRQSNLIYFPSLFSFFPFTSFCSKEESTRKTPFNFVFLRYKKKIYIYIYIISLNGGKRARASEREEDKKKSGDHPEFELWKMKSTLSSQFKRGEKIIIINQKKNRERACRKFDYCRAAGADSSNFSNKSIIIKKFKPAEAFNNSHFVWIYK